MPALVVLTLFGALTQPAEAPRMIGLARAPGHCGCFDDQAVVVNLDREVAALKVFWHGSTEQGETTVVPVDGVFTIAQRSCPRGVPFEALERGVVLGLTAVNLDGSETAVEGVPTIVDVDEIAKLRRAPRKIEFIDPVALAQPAPSRRHPTHGAVPLALIAGAIVVGARKGRAAAAGATSLPRARASQRRSAT
jgi:hypothetical protein